MSIIHGSLNSDAGWDRSTAHLHEMEDALEHDQSNENAVLETFESFLSTLPSDFNFHRLKNLIQASVGKHYFRLCSRILAALPETIRCKEITDPQFQASVINAQGVPLLFCKQLYQLGWNANLFNTPDIFGVTLLQKLARTGSGEAPFFKAIVDQIGLKNIRLGNNFDRTELERCLDPNGQKRLAELYPFSSTVPEFTQYGCSILVNQNGTMERIQGVPVRQALRHWTGQEIENAYSVVPSKTARSKPDAHGSQNPRGKRDATLQMPDLAFPHSSTSQREPAKARDLAPLPQHAEYTSSATLQIDPSTLDPRSIGQTTATPNFASFDPRSIGGRTLSFKNQTFSLPTNLVGTTWNHPRIVTSGPETTARTTWNYPDTVSSVLRNLFSTTWNHPRVVTSGSESTARTSWEYPLAVASIPYAIGRTTVGTPDRQALRHWTGQEIENAYSVVPSKTARSKPDAHGSQNPRGKRDATLQMPDLAFPHSSTSQREPAKARDLAPLPQHAEYTSSATLQIDPSTLDPRSLGQTTATPDFSSLDPRSIDPRSIGQTTALPKFDPSTLDPRSFGQTTATPNFASLDPRSIDPASLDPRSIGRTTATPNFASLDPRSIGGRTLSFKNQTFSLPTNLVGTNLVGTILVGTTWNHPRIVTSGPETTARTTWNYPDTVSSVLRNLFSTTWNHPRVVTSGPESTARTSWEYPLTVASIPYAIGQTTVGTPDLSSTFSSRSDPTPSTGHSNPNDSSMSDALVFTTTSSASNDRRSWFRIHLSPGHAMFAIQDPDTQEFHELGFYPMNRDQDLFSFYRGVPCEIRDDSKWIQEDRALNREIASQTLITAEQARTILNHVDKTREACKQGTKKFHLLGNCVDYLGEIVQKAKLKGAPTLAQLFRPSDFGRHFLANLNPLANPMAIQYAMLRNYGLLPTAAAHALPTSALTVADSTLQKIGAYSHWTLDSLGFAIGIYAFTLLAKKCLRTARSRLF